MGSQWGRGTRFGDICERLGKIRPPMFLPKRVSWPRKERRWGKGKSNRYVGKKGKKEKEKGRLDV